VSELEGAVHQESVVVYAVISNPLLDEKATQMGAKVNNGSAFKVSLQQRVLFSCAIIDAP